MTNKNCLILTIILILLLNFGVGCREYDSAKPTIVITQIPPYPNVDNKNINGEVKGIDDVSKYYIIVYIKVGNWWTKPTYDHNKILLNNSSFTCDITTGGNDQYASHFAVYLLPTDQKAPICGECTECIRCLELPKIPFAIASIPETPFYGIPNNKYLSFSGYKWKIKQSDSPVGPGPNIFTSDKNHVWTDNEGLHLTIKQKNNKWLCTEVINEKSLGHGLYVINTKGRVDLLDPFSVLGLFTWDSNAYDIFFREIDIEFARWGNPNDSTNAQYVVQPYNHPNNLQRFQIDLTDKENELTHFILWESKKLSFATYRGKFSNNQIPPLESLIFKWEYKGNIPSCGDETFRFNMWLMDGKSPISNKNQEIIISNFKFYKENYSVIQSLFSNYSNHSIENYDEFHHEMLENDKPSLTIKSDDFIEDNQYTNNFDFKRNNSFKGFITGGIYSSITGNKTGIAGAKISIIDLDQCTLSDEQGYFSFINIPVGNYILLIESKNSVQKLIKNVEILDSTTTNVSVQDFFEKRDAEYDHKKQSGIKTISFPPYGNRIKNLVGRVDIFDQSEFYIAVYIFQSGWLPKPYKNRPLTFINNDKTFCCDITTKYNDHIASKIAIYMFPKNYTPPQVNGEKELPNELITNSIDQVIKKRIKRN